MKYTKLGQTDLNVSMVSLGTWVFGGTNWGGSKGRECTEVVRVALDCGVNLIDTAPAYGQGLAEILVGKGLKGKRDRYVLATKCGLHHQGKRLVKDLSPGRIRREVDESLGRLQTDYIDLYQTHWPDPKTPIEETMRALTDLQQEGKIKHIGLCNVDVPLLERALAVGPVASVQVQYSLLERSVEAQLLPFCRDKGVGVLTYGTLAGGILSGKYTSAPEFIKDDARNYFYPYYSANTFAVVRQILERLETFHQPLNQVAINWCRQQKGVTSTIVGARHPRQLKANAAAADWDLSPDQLKRCEPLKCATPQFTR